MRKIIALSLLVMLSKTAIASDFRQVTWGMNTKQVQATEKSSRINEFDWLFSPNDTYYQYIVNIDSVPISLTYHLDNDKLYQISLLCKQNSKDELDQKSIYISKCKSLINYISKVYDKKLESKGNFEDGYFWSLFKDNRTMVAVSYNESLNKCEANLFDVNAWEKHKSSYTPR
jgi:hypothetical protein